MVYSFNSNSNATSVLKPEIIHASINLDLMDQGILKANFKFMSPFEMKNPSIGFVLFDYLGTPVFGTNNRIHKMDYEIDATNVGIMNLEIKNLSLLPGRYSVSLFLGDSLIDYSSYLNVFQIELRNKLVNTTQLPDHKYIGSIYLKDVKWTCERI